MLPIPCSPCLFQLGTLPLGLPRKRSKASKHLAWPHKEENFKFMAFLPARKAFGTQLQVVMANQAMCAALLTRTR